MNHLVHLALFVASIQIVASTSFKESPMIAEILFSMGLETLQYIYRDESSDDSTFYRGFLFYQALGGALCMMTHLLGPICLTFGLSDQIYFKFIIEIIKNLLRNGAINIYQGRNFMERPRQTIRNAIVSSSASCLLDYLEQLRAQIY